MNICLRLYISTQPLVINKETTSRLIPTWWFVSSELFCRYNFDPVNDKPLPGRFEWVKMDGTKNVK